MDIGCASGLDNCGHRDVSQGERHLMSHIWTIFATFQLRNFNYLRLVHQFSSACAHFARIPPHFSSLLIDPIFSFVYFFPTPNSQLPPTYIMIDHQVPPNQWESIMIPDFISLFQLRIRISTTHPYSYFTYSLLVLR
jgi:hypothetical protein